MNSAVNDIIAFHNKFGIPSSASPVVLDSGLLDYRTKFLEEELREYKEASVGALQALTIPSLFPNPGEVDHQLAKSLDALVDLVYVAIGTAVVFHGFDFAEAWRRVHQANMAKARAPTAAHTKRKNAHDIIKPPGWQPPVLIDLVT